MVELDPEELALLKRAKKAPLRITFKDRTINLAAGAAERRIAEGLVRRGHLQFNGMADASTLETTGFEAALYSITEHGRCVLDVIAGKVKLDPDDLAHPGCC